MSESVGEQRGEQGGSKPGRSWALKAIVAIMGRITEDYVFLAPHHRHPGVKLAHYCGIDFAW